VFSCSAKSLDDSIPDEPTVGLDPLLRFKIWEFLEEITKASETTIVLTTHYIEEAKQANIVSSLLPLIDWL
jgi:ABC-type multidrug transport system ATPase subunit